MKTTSTATGKPAGAGSARAAISTCVQLVTVGSIALDLWRAQEATANAKHAYHLSINQYEAQHGPLARNIRLTDPAHAAVREFTAPEYAALQKTKRREYQDKLKLRKACADLARMSAETSGGTQ